MSQNETAEAVHKPSRDEIRSKVLSSHKPASRKIKLFGAEIEIRQPSLADIMRAQEKEDPAERTADMIIRYAFVPDSDERVFEEADRQSIVNWPFGPDFIAMQNAITSLTGINIGEAEQELKDDPLEQG